ncbi:MAG: hypothetical protein Q4B05_03760, partial [Candidatus Saccharibacteria bacterium]|nr:hypothetical protein [Candidatus Saccharibacteria bacterium]
VQVNRGEAVYVNSEGVQVNRGEAVYVNSEGVQVSQRDIVVLSYCRRPKKRREIFIKLGLFASQKSWLRTVGHLLEGGYLAPTIPDKLRSRNQQYRTTSKGEELLKKL